MKNTEKTIRLIARLLSVAIILLWGYFLIADIVGEEARGTRPLTTTDYLGLAAMVASLVGLALAWKWELAGALLALVAFALGSMINWRLLASPYVLIPIDALLFLSQWRTRTAPGR